jgi:hypothetical protein
LRRITGQHPPLARSSVCASHCLHRARTSLQLPPLRPPPTPPVFLRVPAGPRPSPAATPSSSSRTHSRLSSTSGQCPPPPALACARLQALAPRSTSPPSTPPAPLASAPRQPQLTPARAPQLANSPRPAPAQHRAAFRLPAAHAQTAPAATCFRARRHCLAHLVSLTMRRLRPEIAGRDTG